MNRVLGLVIVAVSAGGLLVMGGCGGKPAGKPFTIVWNYDTSGYLEPCGCSAHQLGGLSHRATMIADLREHQPVLAIEGPRNLEEGGQFKLFKSEILVKSLNAMKYDAMMLGVQEAQHGISGMQNLVDLAEFPVFNANLKVENASWPEHVVFKEINGTRVAITGVSQPQMVNYDLTEGIRFEDPLTALESVLGGIGEEVHLVVACLEGQTDWIESTVQKFRDRVDLFLTGDLRGITQMSRSQIMERLEFREDPPTLNNLAQGRYLGQVTVAPRRGGYRFSGVNQPIEDTLAEDPTVGKLMAKDFRPRLEDYFAEFTDNLPKTYLPAKGCGDCHPDEYEMYATTGHSQAMESLKKVGQLYNPDCMGCHLAYNPDGDELETMHCVSCHGNIVWNHAFQAEAGMVEMPDPPVTAYTREWCERCHDPINSLPFEKHWPQYVKQVYHGGDMSAAVAAAERMALEINEPPPDFVTQTE